MVTGSAFVPPGWPRAVLPPGTSGWEASAASFLFDCCPADLRGYRVLRNHPVVLAQFAKRFVTGQCTAIAEGLAEVRVSLKAEVPPEVVDAAAQAWLRQGAQLELTRRAVGLLDDALRGARFVAKLESGGYR
jgi:hypothetical protein